MLIPPNRSDCPLEVCRPPESLHRWVDHIWTSYQSLLDAPLTAGTSRRLGPEEANTNTQSAAYTSSSSTAPLLQVHVLQLPATVCLPKPKLYGFVGGQQRSCTRNQTSASLHDVCTSLFTSLWIKVSTKGKCELRETGKRSGPEPPNQSLNIWYRSWRPTWKILPHDQLRLKKNKTNKIMGTFSPHLEVMCFPFRAESGRKWSEHKQLRGAWVLWGVSRPDLFLHSACFLSTSNPTAGKHPLMGVFLFLHPGNVRTTNHRKQRERLMRNTLWGCRLWYGEIVYKSWTKRRRKNVLMSYFIGADEHFVAEWKQKHSSMVSHEELFNPLSHWWE